MGRQFLFQEIDEFISSRQSGYFVIKGDPGIGKTALLAQLVRDRGLIRHFNVIQENIRSPQQFLANVCAQLIVRYDLHHLSIPPSNELEDSTFMNTCLQAAAERTGAPIVIAVDALDEADWRSLPPSVNVHYLPQNLPTGVYFVVTMRRDEDVPLQVHVRFDRELIQNSPENRADIEKYIRLYTGRPRMRQRLIEQAIEEREFITELSTRSQGNFMYLHFVLPAFENGSLQVESVSDLPAGLQAYYQRHWKEMRLEIGGTFKQTHEQVICILAVMPEAVPQEAIAEWAELPLWQVRDIINAWEPFLFSDVIDSEVRYRIYHSTFADFLGEQINLKAYSGLVARAINAKIAGLKADHAQSLLNDS